MSTGTHTPDLFEQRRNFFLSPGTTARGGLIFCILAGVASFGVALYLGQGPRAWASLLLNLYFFYCIGLGGIAFAGMQDVIGASWGRPIMRIHESFASFLPVATGLFVLMFVAIKMHLAGAHEVFKWIADPGIVEPFWGKRDWLKADFMLIRDTAALVAIALLSCWQLKQKLRRDMAFVNGDAAKAADLGRDAQSKLRYWSAPILVAYAILFSLLAFDLLMSLAPLWMSTLWGGWAFSVMMQMVMAALLVAMFALRATPIGQFIRRQQFHDVGKLLHGFTIFFAYITFAHILTYWYGNMPEETEYYIERLHGPWLVLVIVAPILCFVLPLFALIPKTSKWTAGFTLPICALILFAQWLVDIVVVMPEVVEADTWRIPWIEIGGFLGTLGIFLSCIFWFGKRYPMVGVGDPLLADALAGDQH
jgi:hypothetical protein